MDIVTKGLAYTKRTFRYSSNKGARGQAWAELLVEPTRIGGTSSRDEQGVQHDANTGRSNGLPTPTL